MVREPNDRRLSGFLLRPRIGCQLQSSAQGRQHQPGGLHSGRAQARVAGHRADTPEHLDERPMLAVASAG